MTDAARISPTAHYTGFVWYRHGLSPARLATSQGRLFFHGLQGPMALGARSIDGLTLEKMLLQRHLILDHLLHEAVRAGDVTQVVEVAAGMSGRGLRFVERYRDLVYVEADLPGMIARKRRALGARSARHHLVPIDAFAHEGPLSVSRRIPPLLEPREGLAVITEGLLTYFPVPTVHQLWQRFAELLEGHPRGLYLSDVHLEDTTHRLRTSRAFRRFLGLFVSGEVHLTAPDEHRLLKDLRDAGLRDPAIHRPTHYRHLYGIPSDGPDVVRVFSALTGGPTSLPT